jgi:hypothetical protein
MTDFPRSLIEFQHRFANEAACVKIPLRGALAAGLCLPELRQRQGLRVANQGLGLGMLWLWHFAKP